MGRGLSTLQRRILRLAYDKGAVCDEGGDDLSPELLTVAAKVGRVPKQAPTLRYRDIHRECFDVEDTPAPQAVRTSTSRAVRRLEERGLLVVRVNAWTGTPRGVQLTEAGVSSVEAIG